MSTFLPLTRTSESTWELPVDLPLCSGLHTLWGGCGLGAAVQAASEATGRDCAMATVQYLRPIHPDSTLVLTVDAGRAGRSVTQARVTGTVDGQVVLAGSAALGGIGETDLQFVRPPEDVPPPQDCVERTMPLRVEVAGTILARLEQRWAQAPRPVRTDAVPGSGRTRVWIRLREEFPVDAGALAVLADLAPSAVSEATGERAGGVSLDNTIRYARAGAVAAGGWVLLDLTVEAVVSDIAQISGRVFDESGTLLAVAQQSALVRRRPEPRQPRP